MLYPIPWTTGTQIVVATVINLLAIIWLWWPLVRLRLHFRHADRIPFRARLGAVIIFLLCAGIFWAGFLWYDQWVWGTAGKEWIHTFINNWTLPIDIASAIALPAYLYELVFSKNHRGRHHAFGKIMWLALWVIISLGLHLWFMSFLSVKSIVARFA